MTVKPKLARRRRARQGAYVPTRGRFAGRRFTTRAAYRRALERQKRQPVRTLFEVQQLDELDQEIWNRALRVLNQMRTRKQSLTATANDIGITRHQALRYIGSALTKARNGRYVAKARDQLLRPMEFLTPRGRRALYVTDSRTASKIGAYWNAVDEYLRTGDSAMLRPFRGRTIRVAKVTYPFITDPQTLKRLAATDEVRFESIYAHVA